MVRGIRTQSTSRRGGWKVVPMLVAASGFVFVFSAIYWAGTSDDAAPAPATVAQAAHLTAVAQPSEPDDITKPSQRNDVIHVADTVDVAPKPAAAADEASQVVAVEKTVAVPAVEELVAAHLAAGEFGPAMAKAASIADLKQRSLLFKKVAEAQIAVGEFDGAGEAVQQIADSSIRRETQGTLAGQQMRTGGSQADFTQLIQLIQNETAGPWEEVDGEGGTMSQFDQGVRANPLGLMASVSRTEKSGRLDRIAAQVRRADLNEDMAQPSRLRMVSLTRLEAEVAERLAAGQPVVETMHKLAGLTRIQYLFVDPQAGEVIIAGPAEGWEYDATGRPVGVESQWPTLQLDDLVTLLRTFGPGGEGVFGCSIDARQEGLRELKQFVELSNARGPLPPGNAATLNWVRELGNRLGKQDVNVYGVPHNSRIAQVIFEADYRMKLIGIGKLEGGSEIPSFFELLTRDEQKSAKLDALRWWLSMKYDAVLHSPDHRAFEIAGSSVLCQSENQFVSDQGQQISTGQAEDTNRRFAENFTKHYAELASRDLAFADLQNVFDLAMVSAVMNAEGVPEQIGWDLGVFAAGGGYQAETYQTPREIDSVVNHRVYRGSDIVVQVAGGVAADARAVLGDSEKVRTEEGLREIALANQIPELPANRWWWDATE